MRIINRKWHRRIPTGWIINGMARIDIPLSIATDPNIEAVVLEPEGMRPVEFQMDAFRRAIERLWVRTCAPSTVKPFNIDLNNSLVNGIMVDMRSSIPHPANP